MSLPTFDTAKLLDRCFSTIERAATDPCHVEFSAPFLAVVGGVEGHTDDGGFPEWSAFLVLRNDGCRVWSKEGYTGTPKAGDRFTLNIHKTHGVRARRKGGVLAVICADGNNEAFAKAQLERAIKAELSYD